MVNENNEIGLETNERPIGPQEVTRRSPTIPDLRAGYYAIVLAGLHGGIDQPYTDAQFSNFIGDLTTLVADPTNLSDGGVADMVMFSDPSLQRVFVDEALQKLGL